VDCGVRGINHNNYGPEGRLRSVKAMGLAKLKHLAVCDFTDPVLRRRAIGELRSRGIAVKLADPVPIQRVPVPTAPATPSREARARREGKARSQYEVEAAKKIAWPPWEELAEDERERRVAAVA